MQSYVGFVIFILVLGFVIYLAVTSGNLANVFTLGFFRTATTTPAVEEETRQNQPSPQPQPKPEPEPSQPTIIPPQGFTLEQLSPYYQKILITSVDRGGLFGGISSVTVSAQRTAEAINLTGWRILTNDGVLLEIPRGVADYNPRRNLSIGYIYLESGDYLNLYGIDNPIEPVDFNFRLNKCTGYLNNEFDFKPDLPNYCPGIDRQDIVSFSGQCQSFILSLGSCRQPSANEINQFGYDAACRRFLDTISYWSCYENHRSDADFFSKEWRAWLKLGSEFRYYNLDADHDRLLLLDKNGLLVDEYVY